MMINTAPAIAQQLSTTIAVVAPAAEKKAVDRSSALWQQLAESAPVTGQHLYSP
jgi:hypothetical protein